MILIIFYKPITIWLYDITLVWKSSAYSESCTCNIIFATMGQSCGEHTAVFCCGGKGNLKAVWNFIEIWPLSFAWLFWGFLDFLLANEKLLHQPIHEIIRAIRKHDQLKQFDLVINRVNMSFSIANVFVNIFYCQPPNYGILIYCIIIVFLFTCFLFSTRKITFLFGVVWEKEHYNLCLTYYAI